MINNTYEIINSHENIPPNDNTIYTSLKVKQLIDRDTEAYCVFERNPNDTKIIQPVDVQNNEILKIKNVYTDKLQLNGRSIDKVLQQQDTGLGNDYNIFSSKKTVYEIRKAGQELQKQLETTISKNQYFDKNIVGDTMFYSIKNVEEIPNIVLHGFDLITNDLTQLNVQGSTFRHYQKFGDVDYTNAITTNEIYTNKLDINGFSVDYIEGNSDLISEDYGLMTKNRTLDKITEAIQINQKVVEIPTPDGQTRYEFTKKDSTLDIENLKLSYKLDFQEHPLTDIVTSEQIQKDTPYGDDQMITANAVLSMIRCYIPTSTYKFQPNDVLNLFTSTTNPNVSHKDLLPDGYRFVLTSITTIPVNVWPFKTHSFGTFSEWDLWVTWRIVDNVLSVTFNMYDMRGIRTSVPLGILFGEENNNFFEQVFSEIFESGYQYYEAGYTSSAPTYAEQLGYTQNEHFNYKYNYTIRYKSYNYDFEVIMGLEPFVDHFEFSGNVIDFTDSHVTLTINYRIQTFNKNIPDSILYKANVQRWTVMA